MGGGGHSEWRSAGQGGAGRWLAAGEGAISFSMSGPALSDGHLTAPIFCDQRAERDEGRGAHKGRGCLVGPLMGSPHYPIFKECPDVCVEHWKMETIERTPMQS